MQAICEAKENTGDLTLKSDVSASINLRIISERKREELNALEENVQSYTGTRMLTHIIHNLKFFTPFSQFRL